MHDKFLSFADCLEKNSTLYMQGQPNLYWEGVVQIMQDVFAITSLLPILKIGQKGLEILVDEKSVWQGKIDVLGIAFPELEHESLLFA